MTELELFPLARAGDPDTSRQAAQSVTRGMLEKRILAQMGLHGPMTDDELCTCPWLRHYHPPTVKTARSRLSRAGLLVDSGERRLSNRGRKSVVWRLEGSS